MWSMGWKLCLCSVNAIVVSLLNAIVQSENKCFPLEVSVLNKLWIKIHLIKQLCNPWFKTELTTQALESEVNDHE